MKAFYETRYKVLLIIPFALLLLAFIQIGTQYAVTGDFVNKGISLQGGSTITLEEATTISPSQLQATLEQQFPKADLSVRTVGGSFIAIDSDAQDRAEIDVLLNAIATQTGITTEQMSVEIIGSSLGESFFRQTIFALLVAFTLMGIVVFVYFRSFAPSVAVILAAFSDIVVTLAIFNLTGIRLSSAGIAAFLMLIGYSVDTDILLNTRVLKRQEGTVMSRIYGAMKTGLTMSATSLSAITIAIIFVQSDIVKQIMIILFIGLLVDLVMTWIQNVGILRIYLERKK